ncbi:CDP-diacylglycerol-choline O-phosphatidyltransferase [Frankineae bacterium MT45]|nr:CDP-diacylglycerol-choline O-phosphatidyltransferase [Frankineae bacterium MT45]
MQTATPSMGTPTQRGQAWALHVFTTLGVVVGILALREVLVGNAKLALIWLLVSFVIDGVDGPVARVLDVKSLVPVIDGYILDVVIDYVTCVVVPAAFMYQFDLLPSGNWGLFLIGLIVFTSAIWFSRTDMMSDENWFRGFPAAWNLVAPVLYIFQARPAIGAIITVALSILSLTNFPVPHPVRVVWMRPVTLSVTIAWVGAMTIGVLALPHHYWILRPILLAGSIYFLVLGFVQIGRLRSGVASRLDAPH